MNFLVLCLNAVLTNHALFDHIYSHSDKAEIEEAWDRTKKSLEYLLNIIYDRASFHSFKSYELKIPALLVPIVVYLSKNNFAFENDKVLKRFLRWLYLALLWGRYSKRGKSTPLEQDVVTISRDNSPDTLLNNLLRQVRHLEIKSNDLQGVPITNPIFNIAFVVAKSKGAIDWFNGTKLHSNLMGSQYELEKHHIFPGKVLKDAGYYQTAEKKKMVNEIANRAFLTEKANRQILKSPPDDYLPKVKERYPQALQHQFVTEKNDLYKLDNFEDFLKDRRIRIANEINKFLEKLVVEESPATNIHTLIKEDECATLEFKSSFLWNYKESREDKSLRFATLKTVAGFMNSLGGVLILGVDDERNILGLDNDYSSTFKNNRDSFLLELQDYLESQIGLIMLNRCIGISFQKIDGKDVCIIEVEKGPKPVYVRKDKEKALYVRTGNKTERIVDPEDITEYVKDTWENE